MGLRQEAVTRQKMNSSCVPAILQADHGIDRGQSAAKDQDVLIRFHGMFRPRVVADARAEFSRVMRSNWWWPVVSRRQRH